MEATSILEQLDQAIAAAAPADRHALVAAVLVRVSGAMLAVSPPLAPDVPAPPSAFLTPEQAAAIANLPMTTEEETAKSVRRVYGWARGKRWASNPTGRCLRIEEAGFRRWLVSRP